MVQLPSGGAGVLASASLVFFAPVGCTDRAAGDDADTSTGSSSDRPHVEPSTEATTLEPSAQTTLGDDDTTGSFASSSDADSTTSIPMIECELLDGLDVSQGSVWGEWADGPVDVTCDALSLDEVFDDGFYFLRMMCADARNDGPLDLAIDASIVDRFVDLPGTAGLRLSFFEGGIINSSTYTLRAPDGELIVLSYGRASPRYESNPDMIVARAPWLEGTPEWETWNAPFGEMWLRDIGCIPVELNSAGSPHKPLVIEIPTDAGPLAIPHHGAEQVQVDGRLFDISVRDAVQLQDATGLPPGHAVLYVGFVILRAP